MPKRYRGPHHSRPLSRILLPLTGKITAGTRGPGTTKERESAAFHCPNRPVRTSAETRKRSEGVRGGAANSSKVQSVQLFFFFPKLPQEEEYRKVWGISPIIALIALFLCKRGPPPACRQGFRLRCGFARTDGAFAVGWEPRVFALPLSRDRLRSSEFIRWAGSAGRGIAGVANGSANKLTVAAATTSLRGACWRVSRPSASPLRLLGPVALRWRACQLGWFRLAQAPHENFNRDSSYPSRICIALARR